MLAIEKDQLRAIAGAVKRCRSGVKRALDPADAADAAAIRAFLGLCGKDSESHPALHEDLEKMGSGEPAPDDHELQVLEIVDRGRDPDGKATARVWHLDREGGFMSGSAVLVLNARSGRPLATGFANRVGGGLCPAATRTRTALPASSKITVIGFYHSQPRHDASPRFGMITVTQDIGKARK